MRVGDIVVEVRSKNAGPFWVTIDVFCGDTSVFDSLRAVLTNKLIAGLYALDEQSLLRFELSDLNVIKFSFPRPVVQGSQYDRDMHGAQYSVLLSELEFDSDQH